jgi:hypothetical protein
MDCLDGADILTLGDQLLLTQVGIYEQSTSEHFCHWALDMYKTVVAWVNRCCFGDHGTILATVSPDNVITYETLAEASNKKYDELVGCNRYPPAIKIQPTPDDTPIAMLSGCVEEPQTEWTVQEHQRVKEETNRWILFCQVFQDC